MHGIRMQGDFDHIYAIEAGRGACRLTKMSGGLSKVSTIDLPPGSRLSTQNLGVIEVFVAGPEQGLLPALARLRTFLRASDAEQVLVTLED